MHWKGKVGNKLQKIAAVENASILSPRLRPCSGNSSSFHIFFRTSAGTFRHLCQSYKKFPYIHPPWEDKVKKLIKQLVAFERMQEPFSEFAASFWRTNCLHLGKLIRDLRRNFPEPCLCQLHRFIPPWPESPPERKKPCCSLGARHAIDGGLATSQSIDRTTTGGTFAVQCTYQNYVVWTLLQVFKTWTQG